MNTLPVRRPATWPPAMNRFGTFDSNVWASCRGTSVRVALLQPLQHQAAAPSAAVNRLGDRRAGGEHEDRHVVPRRAQPPADLETIEAGQAAVQDDRVVGGRCRRCEALVARDLLVHLVARASERSFHRAPDRGIVLHQEDVHVSQSRQRSLRHR